MLRLQKIQSLTLITGFLLSYSSSLRNCYDGHWLRNLNFLWLFSKYRLKSASCAKNISVRSIYIYRSSSSSSLFSFLLRHFCPVTKKCLCHYCADSFSALFRYGSEQKSALTVYRHLLTSFSTMRIAVQITDGGQANTFVPSLYLSHQISSQLTPSRN